MNQKDTIRELLQKYELRKPLPLEQKRNLPGEKKSTLILILKKKKKYSVFLFLAIPVYFGIKRFGLSLTLFKSVLLVFLAIVLLTGGITTGTILTLDWILTKDKKVEHLKKKTEHVPKENEKEKTAPAPNYTITMNYFTYDTEIRDIGTTVNRTIAAELIRLKGSNAIALHQGNKAIGTRKIITGSIVKISESYLITTKIIDRKTSRVLFHASESAASDKEVTQACLQLSQKIAGEM